MDIVMTLMARCDMVSGIWQLQREEEINGELQQKRRQLEVMGISTSNAKLLDGTYF
jgi:cytochrome oxidase assembly protein ShyY1